MADGFWNRPAALSAATSASAMADGGYWNQQAPVNPAVASLPKRPRTYYDLPHGVPSGHEMHNYLTQDDDRTRLHPLKDTNSIGASYDLFLQNSKLSSLGATEGDSNFGGTGLSGGIGGMPGLPIGEPARMGGPGFVGPDVASNVRNTGYSGQVPLDPFVRSTQELPLPPDASCTLFIEGLPPDSTQREVAHIFRPFLGFKELRLVNKGAKYKGGGPLFLCFVDFKTPGCAASALGAVQGYKFDEEDPDSPILRVQFARFPTRKSGPPRNKR